MSPLSSLIPQLEKAADRYYVCCQVVYDVSKGPEEIDRLKPWLSNIHFRAPGCPVIVVGTHFDKLDPGETFSEADISPQISSIDIWTIPIGMTNFPIHVTYYKIYT